MLKHTLHNETFWVWRHLLLLVLLLGLPRTSHALDLDSLIDKIQSAYDKLVSVWCSDDRTLAMNNAKLKRQFSPKTCTNPVASQYQLTRKLGLSGTPALILPDGELIAGYVPFERLQKHLQDKAQQAETAGR